MADVTSPSQAEVKKFHKNADTDGTALSIHHTLGPRAAQASPGNHRHNGGDSGLLLEGLTLTGAKGGNVALTNLIQLLVDNMGLTDATT